MIRIVDYGMGNLASVANMIRHIGGESEITSDPATIASADKLILPGVGAFDAGMGALRERRLDQPIRDAVSRGGMLLGICLGMQLLLEGSEEGRLPGLGLVPGSSRLFRAGHGLRVPHMGWNVVRPVRPSVLFAPGEVDEQRFYFVHSYYAECARAEDVCGVATYGLEYAAALQRDRVLGAQFHPEKSHRFGMALLKRFSEAT